MRNHCHTRNVVWSKIPQHALEQESVKALRRESRNREKKMKQQSVFNVYGRIITHEGMKSSLSSQRQIEEIVLHISNASWSFKHSSVIPGNENIPSCTGRIGDLRKKIERTPTWHKLCRTQVRKWMKLDFKGVDISTEAKFIRYIKSLNKEIMKRNAKTEGPKETLYYRPV